MIDEIQITASGSTEPVTLKEAKAFLKVDYNDSDDLIKDLITAAREQIESYCSVSLITHTVKVFGSGFIQCQLPYYPVDSSSIVLTDENSNTITGFERLGDKKAYVEYNGSEAIRYTFTYNTTAISNKSLLIALMHYVKWMWDNSDMARTSVGFTSFITDKMNLDAKNIMDQFRLL